MHRMYQDLHEMELSSHELLLVYFLSTLVFQFPRNHCHQRNRASLLSLYDAKLSLLAFLDDEDLNSDILNEYFHLHRYCLEYRMEGFSLHSIHAILHSTFHIYQLVS